MTHCRACPIWKVQFWGDVKRDVNYKVLFTYMFDRHPICSWACVSCREVSLTNIANITSPFTNDSNHYEILYKYSELNFGSHVKQTTNWRKIFMCAEIAKPLCSLFNFPLLRQNIFSKKFWIVGLWHLYVFFSIKYNNTYQSDYFFVF